MFSDFSGKMACCKITAVMETRGTPPSHPEAHTRVPNWVLLAQSRLMTYGGGWHWLLSIMSGSADK